LYEFGNALGGRDRAGFEIYTWRPSSCDFGDTLRGHDRARLEVYLEAVNLEAVVWEGGATGAETLFIGYVLIVGM